MSLVSPLNLRRVGAIEASMLAPCFAKTHACSKVIFKGTSVE